jgi:predicted naringenin-chalcone synthase
MDFSDLVGAGWAITGVEAFAETSDKFVAEKANKRVTILRESLVPASDTFRVSRGVERWRVRVNGLDVAYSRDLDGIVQKATAVMNSL